jgi:hypothetical protein
MDIPSKVTIDFICTVSSFVHALVLYFSLLSILSFISPNIIVQLLIQHQPRVLMSATSFSRRSKPLFPIRVSALPYALSAGLDMLDLLVAYLLL